jgi:hypothetical protein
MNVRARQVLVLFCLLVPAAAPAAVSVTTPDPYKFSDAWDRAIRPEDVMRELTKEFEKLAALYLPANTDVRVELHDVDLAGNAQRNPQNMRVVRGPSDFPCIDLSVSVGGAPAVREKVCDMKFMRSLGAGYHRDDVFVYEKRMLGVWFKSRFVPKKAEAR